MEAIGYSLVIGFVSIGALAALVLLAAVVSNGFKNLHEEEEHLCEDGIPSWGWNGYREDPESWDPYHYDCEYCNAPESYKGTVPEGFWEGAAQARVGEGDPEADSGLAETVRPGALAAEQRVGVRGPTDDSAGS